MKSIRALIIDDEASARENLTLLLSRFCPNIEVVHACNVLHKGVDYLKVNPIDVVFLDVEMPEHAGYEIVDFFDEISFDIVFCTAYDKYAIKAFEISAIDYLLKPIDVGRLKQVALKLAEKQQFKMTQTQVNHINTSFRNTIKVMNRGERVLLKKSDIIAIEAQSAYSVIHTTNKQYTASKNIAQLEEELKEDLFFYRCQKSWMVNLNYIQSVNKTNRTVHLSQGIEAKVSRQKAKEFYEMVRL